MSLLSRRQNAVPVAEENLSGGRNWKVFWLALFVVHFTLVLAVSLQATLRLIARNRTLLRASSFWQGAESVAAGVLAQHLPETNPVRQGVVTYLNAAGIETSYGFFAPNVPFNYRLVFELHYADGRVETALPEVADAAAGKRLSNLFDHIATTRNDRLRETLIKMLAYAVWQNHPEVVGVRAAFGYARLPTLAQFNRGEKESYQTVYVYDFAFAADHPESGPEL